MEAQVTWNAEWSGEAQIMVYGLNDCGEGEISTPLMVMMTAMPEMPTIQTGETDLCEDNSNTMYETTGATGADEYVWELLPAEAGTITYDGMTAEVQWAEGYDGDAMVHVKALNTCGESDFSDAVAVTLAPKPEKPETISGPDGACQGVTVSFDVTEIANALSCEWMIEPAEAGVVTSDGMTCDITVSETWLGDAIIATRGLNDCGTGEWSDGFTLSVQDCTGIDENNTTVTSIYPNPNSGVFTISLEANEMISIKLINAIGEVVYAEDGVQVSGSVNKQIETSGLANCVYYLNLTGETVNSIEKIIIRK